MESVSEAVRSSILKQKIQKVFRQYGIDIDPETPFGQHELFPENAESICRDISHLVQTDSKALQGFSLNGLCRQTTGQTQKRLARGHSLVQLRRSVSRGLSGMRLDESPVDAPFLDLGLNSLDLVTLATAVREDLGIQLEDSFFFDYGTLESSSKELFRRINTPLLRESQVPKFCLEDSLELCSMSFTIPCGKDLRDVDEAIMAKRSAIKEVPASRWDWKEFGQGNELRWGGFCRTTCFFDFEHFGMTKLEASVMDPQHRMFLQETFNCRENSMMDLRQGRTGVYVGISKNDYAELMRASSASINPFVATGTVHSIVANRVSFLFDLSGPSCAVDTACSSALVALSLAKGDVSQGHADMALVGGVNALLSPTMFLTHKGAGMLSQTGRCASFDKSADGYIRAEGVVVALLSPKRQDLEARLSVLGCGVSHGGKAAGLTVPRSQAQAKVMEDALQKSGLSHSDVNVIECHGTGTPLGDPIEVEGIKKVFLYSRPDTLVLTSFKTICGHLESCAGFAGLVKIVASCERKYLGSILHFNSLNPRIDLEFSNMILPVEPIDMPRGNSVSGLSSFGMGGVNAHCVIRENTRTLPSANCNDLKQLRISISADSFEKLKILCEKVSLFLLFEHLSVEDMCKLFQFRQKFQKRMDFVGLSKKDFVKKLRVNDSCSIVTQSEDARNGVVSRPIWGPSYPLNESLPWFQKSAVSSTNVGHGFISEHTASRRIIISRDAFFLRDHVVAGEPILPGVMFLEIASSVSRKFTTLQNAAWFDKAKPLGQDGLEIDVEVNESHLKIIDSSRKVTLFSAISCESADYVELITAPSAFGQKLSHEAIYAQFRHHGLSYGKRMQPLQNFSCKGCFAVSEGTVEDTDDWSQFVLHPTIMDGAFQTCVLHHIMTHVDGEVMYLPFSIEQISRYLPLTREFKVVAKEDDLKSSPGSMLRYHINICDTTGTVLVEIRGFSRRPAKIGNQVKRKCDVYRILWEEATTQQKDEANSEVFGICDMDVETNGSENFQFVRFEKSCDFEFGLNILKFNMSSKEHWIKLLIVLQKKLIHTLGLQIKDLVPWSVTLLVQAMIETKFYPKTIIFVADTGDVEFCKRICASGVARTAQYENPDIHLRFCIGSLSLNFLQECSRTNADMCEVRYKDGKRFVPSLERYKITSQAQVNAIRTGGTYLVTGGVGGLGKIFCLFLLKEFKANLIIMGRKSVDHKEVVEAMSIFRGFGSKIVYEKLDISDKERLGCLSSSPWLKNLNGVLHCAGVIKDAFILRTKEQGFADVTSPKIKGTIELDKLTSGCKLDFFVTFSSIASWLPNQGQAAYAAGNRFMDEFCRNRNDLVSKGHRSGQSLSIGWSLWRSGGMGVSEVEAAHLLKSFGISPIESGEGVLSFVECLNDSLQTGVCHVIVASPNSSLKFSKNEVKSTNVIPSKMHSEKIADFLLDCIIKELQLEPGEITVDSKFSDVGITSMVISGINDRVEKKFGQVSKTLFFEYSCVRDLLLDAEKIFGRVSAKSSGETAEVKHRFQPLDFDSSLSVVGNESVRYTLKQSDFVCCGFTIGGKNAVPGGFFVELAISGLLSISPNFVTYQVAENFWPLALTFDEDEEILLDVKYFKKSDNCIEFAISTSHGLHASGRFSQDVRGSHASVLGSEIQEGVRLSMDSFYKKIEANSELKLFGNFRLVEEFSFSPNESRAKVRIADEGFDKYHLHPVLTTAVEQCLLVYCAFLYEKLLPNLILIPVSIEKISVFARLTSKQFTIVCKSLSKVSSSNRIHKFVASMFCENSKEEVAKFEGNGLRISTLKSTRVHEPFFAKVDKNAVGISSCSCRVFQSWDISNFSQQLFSEQMLISEVPKDRWSRDKHENAPRWGCFFEGMFLFDNVLFSISPRECQFMDPQHRISLECAFEASSGVSLVKENTGVFVGIGKSEFAAVLAEMGFSDTHMETGTWGSGCSGRISYILDLQGRSISVDTACSSSLVAFEMGFESISVGGDQFSIVGGVNFILSPLISSNYLKAGMLSQDGRCKTFDASANGYVRGEGCAFFVLSAMKSECTILSCNSNQDGKSAGLTAPNGKAQLRLLEKTLSISELSKNNIDIFEAHGTGTKLGDPIETNAIVKGLARRSNPIILGTIKSSIGHLETAAGAFGIINCIVQSKSSKTIRHTTFTNLNPIISGMEEIMAVISLEGVDLKRDIKTFCISSFGFTGTNAQVCLQIKQATAEKATVRNFIVAMTASRHPVRTKLMMGDPFIRIPRSFFLKSFGTVMFGLCAKDLDDTLKAESLWLNSIEFNGNKVFNVTLVGPCQCFGAVQDLKAALHDMSVQPELRMRLSKGSTVTKYGSDVVSDILAEILKDCIFIVGKVHGSEERVLKFKEKVRTADFEGIGSFEVQSLRCPRVSRRERFLYAFGRRRRSRLGDTILLLGLSQKDSIGNLMMSSPQICQRTYHSPFGNTQERTFKLDYFEQSPYAIEDHQVYGNLVVPAACHISIILSQISELNFFHGIRNVEILSAVVLSEDAKEVVYTLDGRTRLWKVSYKDEINAKGEIDDKGEVSTTNLSQSDFGSSSEIVNWSNWEGMHIGPSFRWMESARRNEVESFSTFSAPREWKTSNLDLPAELLDSIFQNSLLLLRDQGYKTFHSPFAFRRVALRGKFLGGKVFSKSVELARSSKSITMDCFSASEDNSFALEINGGVFLEATKEKFTHTKVAAFQTEWKIEPLLAFQEKEGDEKILLISEDRNRLELFLPDATVLRAERLIKQEMESYQVIVNGEGLSKKLQIQKLTETWKKICSLGTRPRIFGLFVQANKLGDRTRVKEISRALWCFCRTLQKETVGKFGAFSLIDIEYNSLALSGASLEITSKTNLDEVGFDEKFRYVPELKMVSLERNVDLQFDREVSLISGGYGGLASLLVGKFSGDILLGINQTRVLSQKPICSAICDVSKEEDTRLCVSYTRAIISPKVLRAFHLAGKIQDALFMNLSWTDFREVLRPKLGGLQSLAKVAPQKMYLFSSIASSLGNIGQANYSLANGVLDGFAENHPDKCLSLCWGAWNYGMHSKIEKSQRKIEEISKTEGLESIFSFIKAGIGGCVTVAVASFSEEKSFLVRNFSKETSNESSQKADEGSFNEILKDVLGMTLDSQISYDLNFTDLGFDSMLGLELRKKLEAAFRLDLPATLIFDFPTPRKLETFLLEKGSKREEILPIVGSEIPDPANTNRIVGASCRFGSSKSVSELGVSLGRGEDMIKKISRKRWEFSPIFNDAQPTEYHAGVVDSAGAFDADFFRISSREAKFLDPQQKLLLHVAWECIESGGMDPFCLSGSDTGVFVGIASAEYAYSSLRGNYHEYGSTGVQLSTASGRLSFILDVNGPCMSIDTACSSSLVALVEGCTSTCSEFLSLGVQVICTPILFESFKRAGMLSPDLRCKTFDESANGYVRGEGCGGFFLVKDLSSKGCTVEAFGVNQDGRTNGLTAPNGSSQTKLVQKCWKGLDFGRAAFVECHGTGTSLGDPIEVSALGNVFSQIRNSIILGSVKTNLGHSETAAGSSSLCKLISSFLTNRVFRNLHFTALNKHIGLIQVQERKFVFPLEEISLDKRSYLFGLSSFGYSGTNSHAVLSSCHGDKEGVQEHNVLISSRSRNYSDTLKIQITQTLKESRSMIMSHCTFHRRSEFFVKGIGSSRKALFFHTDVCRHEKANLCTGRTPYYHTPFVQHFEDFELDEHWLTEEDLDTKAKGTKVADILQSVLGSSSKFDPDSSWKDLGVDSIVAMEFIHELRRSFGEAVPTSILFEFTSIKNLQDHFDGNSKDLKNLEVFNSPTTNDDAIFLSGASCRFGSARGLRRLSELFVAGVDLVSQCPKDRDLEVEGGYVQDIFMFDHENFNISMREAVSMDPQQRMILECSWEALDSCGLAPWTLREEFQNTAVIVGIQSSEFCFVLNQREETPFFITGVSQSVASGRVSYFYGLDGPSFSVATACSSGLVALAQGCSLLHTTTSACLTFGVNALFDPYLRQYISSASMLSPSSRCKSFDNTADGYVRSEGCGCLFVSRRLESEVMMLSYDTNQDGKSNGLTAPNGGAQRKLLVSCSEKAGTDVDMVEAHGTGTKLGDPIEVQSISQSFRRQLKGNLCLTSSKANYGHAETAAGSLGVLKVLCTFASSKVPSLLHFSCINSNIGATLMEEASIVLGNEQIDSQRMTVAGVSSFGFSGTNCHVILKKINKVLPISSEKEVWTFEENVRYDAFVLLGKTCFRSLVAYPNHPHMKLTSRQIMKGISKCDDSTWIYPHSYMSMRNLQKTRVLPDALDRQKEAVSMTNPQIGDRAKILVLKAVKEVLGLSENAQIDDRKTLIDLGFDSVLNVDLASKLSQKFDMEVPSTIAYDYPKLGALTEKMMSFSFPRQKLSQKRQAYRKNLKPSLSGYSCRLSKFCDPEEFWASLVEGEDLVTVIPRDRWRFDDSFSPVMPLQEGKSCSKWGCFFNGMHEFDYRLFNISEQEARHIDPQQQLVLETSWEALEAAEHDPLGLSGSKIGVYGGIEQGDFWETTNTTNHFLSTGYSDAVACGRVSYFFGLVGAAISVNTACSSSLVAMSIALNNLSQEDGALCFGVKAMFSQRVFVVLSQAGMMSPTGRCKSFDQDADGYVRCEGCVSLLLEKKEKSMKIEAISCNQDGTSNGLTAPNGVSQVSLIEAAQVQGGISSDQIHLAEAHGTGTSLGDPIEIASIFETFRNRSEPLLLRSIKATLGHGEHVAGITGMLSCILSCSHGIIPKQLQFRSINKHIGQNTLLKMRGVIPLENVSLTKSKIIFCINSFGFSGTNCHVIGSMVAKEENLKIGTSTRIVLRAFSKNDASRQEEALFAWVKSNPISSIQGHLIFTQSLNFCRLIELSCLKEISSILGKGNSRVSSYRRFPSYQFSKDRVKWSKEIERRSDAPVTGVMVIQDQNVLFQLTSDELSAWYSIQDHVVYGVEVVPGAAHLIIVQAQRELVKKVQGGLQNVEQGGLQNVEFRSPLVVTKVIMIQYIHQENDSIKVQTRNERGYVEHAALSACSIGQEDHLGTEDDMRNCITKEWIDLEGIEYGESFKWISTARVTESQSASGLVCPKFWTGQKDIFVPVELLDSMFQTTAFFSSENHFRAPFSLERIFFIRKFDVKSTSKSLILTKLNGENKRANAITVDVELIQAEKCNVMIRGFTIVKADKQAFLKHTGTKSQEDSYLDLSYEVKWSPLVQVQNAENVSQVWVAGTEHTIVHLKQIVEETTLRIRSLLNEKIPKDEWILCAYGLCKTLNGKERIKLTLFTYQDVLQRNHEKIMTITMSAQSFRCPFKTVGNPWSTALWSMGRALSIELNSKISHILVDVVEDVKKISLLKLCGLEKQTEVLIRDHRYYRGVLKRINDPRTEPSRTSYHVVLLGGSGGIGKEMTMQYQRRGTCVSIFSRSSMVDFGKDSLFSQFLVNCTSLEQSMSGMINLLLCSGKYVDEVVHLAGCLSDKTISSLLWSDFQKTLSPKVAPMRYFWKASVPSLILFSSATSSIGNFGQLNYAAANGFLDGLSSKKGSKKIVSINWGPWNAGMFQTLENTSTLSTLDVHEALSLVDFAKSLKRNNLTIISLEWSKIDSETFCVPLLGDFVKPSFTTLKQIDDVRGTILAIISEILGAETLDDSIPLSELGMDSALGIELRNRIAKETGVLLSATLLFDYPTASGVIGKLSQVFSSQKGKHIDEELARPSTISRSGTSISVCGLACRFGKARTMSELSVVFLEGVDCASLIPQERFSWMDIFGRGKSLTKFGTFVDGVELFDHTYFGISPREAAAMDPKNRFLLETALEACHMSSKDPYRLEDEGSVGVYVGVWPSEYLDSFVHEEQSVAYLAVGTSPAAGSGRVSYTFGFSGAAVSIDTACSSSLVAFHYASEALLQGAEKTALCFGTNFIGSGNLFIIMSKAGMLSKDGRCKTFDISADGYGRGEGCGACLIGVDKDQLGAIESVNVNQDGKSQGLTAPNGPAQVKLIEHALRKSGSNSIDLFEAHGTGTALGDPIELNAIREVFSSKKKSMLIGSSKANFGHSETAAGILGMLRMFCCFFSSNVNLHIQFRMLNEHIGEKAVEEFYGVIPLENVKIESGLRSAVSSFGFSGTNAHVILRDTFLPRFETPTRFSIVRARARANFPQVVETHNSWLVERNLTKLFSVATSENCRALMYRGELFEASSRMQKTLSFVKTENSWRFKSLRLVGKSWGVEAGEEQCLVRNGNVTDEGIEFASKITLFALQKIGCIVDEQVGSSFELQPKFTGAFIETGRSFQKRQWKHFLWIHFLQAPRARIWDSSMTFGMILLETDIRSSFGPFPDFPRFSFTQFKHWPKQSKSMETSGSNNPSGINNPWKPLPIRSPSLSNEYDISLSLSSQVELNDMGGLVHVGMWIEMISQVIHRTFAHYSSSFLFTAALFVKEVTTLNFRVQKSGFSVSSQKSSGNWIEHCHGSLSVKEAPNFNQGLSQLKDPENILTKTELYNLISDAGQKMGESVAVVELIEQWKTRIRTTLRTFSAEDVRKGQSLPFPIGYLDGIMQSFFAVVPRGSLLLTREIFDFTLSDGISVREEMRLCAIIELSSSYLGGQVYILDESGEILGSFKCRLDAVKGVSVSKSKLDKSTHPVIEILKNILIDVSEIHPEQSDLDRALVTLGLDSLMAISFAAQLKTQYDWDVHGAEILGSSLFELERSIKTRFLLSPSTHTNDVHKTGSKSFFRLDRDDSSMFLLCFPFGGGGSSAFEKFKMEFESSKCCVLPIVLAGRDDRWREESETEFERLVIRISDEISGKFKEKRFSLLGHSLGGAIAFALAVDLEKRFGMKPDKIFICACPSPQIGLQNEVLRRFYQVSGRDKVPKLAETSTDEMKNWILSMNSSVGETMMEGSFISSIHADLQIAEGFYNSCNWQDNIIINDIVCIAATEDPLVQVESQKDWGRYCRTFTLVTLDSMNHLFILTSAHEVAIIVKSKLE